MNSTHTTIHVIDKLPDSLKVFEDILCFPGNIRILDLSTGQLGTPSNLYEKVMPLINQSGKTVEWLDAQEYAPFIGDSSRKAFIEWFSRAGDIKVKGSKSIKELFTYKGSISLWWQTDMADKRHTHPYRWLFYSIFTLRYILRDIPESEGCEWYIWTIEKSNAKVLSRVLGGRKVKVHLLRKNNNKSFKSYFDKLLKPLKAVYHITNSIIWLIKEARGSANKASHIDKKSIILFHTIFPKSWQKMDKSPLEGVSYWDSYFGEAPWRLKEAGFDVRWMPVINKGSMRKWHEYSTQSLPDVLPLMKFGYNLVFTMIGHLVKWNLKYLTLFYIAKVENKLLFEDIPLGHWIREEYYFHAINKGVRDMVLVEKYKSVIRSLRPKAILYRDEFYSSGRCLASSVDDDTRLIGVQHGMINREATTYQFIPEDFNFQKKDYIHYCPAPDVFLSFGEYYTAFFKKINGYPHTKVLPIGGLRHDSVVTRFKNGEEDLSLLKSDLLKQAGLPENKKLIVLCTVLAKDAGRWFELVVDSVGGIKTDFYIVVKIHPNYGGKELIDEMALTRNFTSYKVFNNLFYELLFLADVMVSGASTTTLEAVLLNTPVITIAATDTYELYPYKEEKIGIQVQSTKEMSDALNSVLKIGEKGKEGFAQRRETILKRHLNNGDGGAIRRLAELIESETNN